MTGAAQVAALAEERRAAVDAAVEAWAAAGWAAGGQAAAAVAVMAAVRAVRRGQGGKVMAVEVVAAMAMVAAEMVVVAS